jgi:hypothetical protein
MSVETHTAEPARPAKRKTINIFINDVHHQVDGPIMTGAELCALGGIPDANQLFLEVPGPGDDDPIGRDQVVELKSGMRFYDVPTGNLG